MQIFITSENLSKVDVGNGVLSKENADDANDVHEGRRRSPQNLPLEITKN